MRAVLDGKLKAGRHSYKAALQPTISSDAQSFSDLQYDAAGQLAPLKGVWQFQLSLVKAVNVAATGARAAWGSTAGAAAGGCRGCSEPRCADTGARAGIDVLLGLLAQLAWGTALQQ